MLIDYYRNGKCLNLRRDVSPHTLFMNSLIYLRYQYLWNEIYFEALYFLWILINLIKNKIEKKLIYKDT